MKDHSSCTHPRTPAGRAACRRNAGVEERRQMTAEAPKERRVRNDTQSRLPDADKLLRTDLSMPARVRTFLNVARARGLRIQPHKVERGISFHVLSDVAAITVTWDNEETKWFARRGFSSLSQEIKHSQVWEVLEGRTSR